jgi:LAO/AO transport system kinase
MPRAMKARESTDELLVKLQRGDRGALARLLSLAESEPARYAEVADRVTALSGRALRVGITGPGGAGKSTLIDALVARLRADGRRVAILATDPSSERTGGALLGDRVRYAPGAVDEGVFFRSVATRGASGGFAHAGFDQLDLLDAAGFDWLLVEAVGAGQSEVEIAYAVDLTLVVLPPASGDAVQAMKAGVMEAGDLFVVSKCDLPGAAAAAAVLGSVLELQNAAGRSPPPVLLASATHGTGLPELAAELARLAQTRHDTGDLAARRRDRLARRVRHLVQRDLEPKLAAAAAEAAAKGGTPQALAREVKERLRP